MPPLYDHLGGKPALTSVVNEFCDRLVSDPSLAHYFKGVDLGRHKRHLRAFIAGAIGGPDVYAKRDMGAVHADLSITPAVFDRTVDHLVAALRSHNVAAHLIEALGATVAPLRAQIATGGELRAA